MADIRCANFLGYQHLASQQAPAGSSTRRLSPIPYSCKLFTKLMYTRRNPESPHRPKFTVTTHGQKNRTSRGRQSITHKTYMSPYGHGGKNILHAPNDVGPAKLTCTPAYYYSRRGFRWLPRALLLSMSNARVVRGTIPVYPR